MTFAQTFLLADPQLHDLRGFDCGRPEMDRFLVQFAIKNMRLGLSRTWVLPLLPDEPANPRKVRIATYYTLAASTVTREEVPTNKPLPGYPVPMVLLARLAVNKRYQRQRLGEKTLITALRKAVELTDTGLPALGLILDVLDREALRFYQSFELFEPFTDNPMRLFVPMRLLRGI